MHQQNKKAFKHLSYYKSTLKLLPFWFYPDYHTHLENCLNVALKNFLKISLMDTEAEQYQREQAEG